MSNFSLNPDMTVEVKVKFIAQGSDTALTGSSYRVKLFDKDFIGEDHLGESGLDANGIATIKFSHRLFGEWNNLEKYPDFYFVLLKDGQQIFKSEIMENFDLENMERFKMGEGDIVDLGTYLVKG